MDEALKKVLDDILKKMNSENTSAKIIMPVLDKVCRELEICLPSEMESLCMLKLERDMIKYAKILNDAKNNPISMEVDKKFIQVAYHMSRLSGISICSMSAGLTNDEFVAANIDILMDLCECYLRESLEQEGLPRLWKALNSENEVVLKKLFKVIQAEIIKQGVENFALR